MILEIIILAFNILNLLILLGVMSELLDLRDFVYDDS